MYDRPPLFSTLGSPYFLPFTFKEGKNPRILFFTKTIKLDHIFASSTKIRTITPLKFGQPCGR
jgi:hypothetical protein